MTLSGFLALMRVRDHLLTSSSPLLLFELGVVLITIFSLMQAGSITSCGGGTTATVSVVGVVSEGGSLVFVLVGVAALSSTSPGVDGSFVELGLSSFSSSFLAGVLVPVSTSSCGVVPNAFSSGLFGILGLLLSFFSPSSPSSTYSAGLSITCWFEDDETTATPIAAAIVPITTNKIAKTNTLHLLVRIRSLQGKFDLHTPTVKPRSTSSSSSSSSTLPSSSSLP
mmetsp:Transcript_14282/g.30497  ORF Transcript_14282/g.30497 Transcript_14282/m.30497 type:complete len:225 (-) Transcript_14282:361-1035(-)